MAGALSGGVAGPRAAVRVDVLPRSLPLLVLPLGLVSILPFAGLAGALQFNGPFQRNNEIVDTQSYQSIQGKRKDLTEFNIYS